MSQNLNDKGAGMTEQATNPGDQNKNEKEKDENVIGNEPSGTKKVILTPEKFGELVRETEEIIEKIEESLEVDPDRLKSRITI